MGGYHLRAVVLMILDDTQIINRLAEKATELEIDLEASSERYLAKIMALAAVCDFVSEQVADQYFTGALQKGLAWGEVKRVPGKAVGTA